MIKRALIAIDENGECGPVFELEGGGFACPICGSSIPHTYVGGSQHEFGPHTAPAPTAEQGSRCSACTLEFPIEFEPTFFGFRHARQMLLRARDWDGRLLERIKSGLGLSTDSLHAEGVAVWKHQVGMLRGALRFHDVPDTPTAMQVLAGEAMEHLADVHRRRGELADAKAYYEMAIREVAAFRTDTKYGQRAVKVEQAAIAGIAAL